MVRANMKRGPKSLPGPIAAAARARTRDSCEATVTVTPGPACGTDFSAPRAAGHRDTGARFVRVRVTEAFAGNGLRAQQPRHGAEPSAQTKWRPCLSHSGCRDDSDEPCRNFPAAAPLGGWAGAGVGGATADPGAGWGAGRGPGSPLAGLRHRGQG